MARIFTPAMIAEIVRRANLGAGAQAIANDLGLNVNSLRVKCSGLGISLRRCRDAREASREHKRPRTTSHGTPLFVVVPRLAAMQLRQWSASKNMTVEELAAELLAVIAADGLCNAILDDDVESPCLAPRAGMPATPCRSSVALAGPGKDKSVA